MKAAKKQDFLEIITIALPRFSMQILSLYVVYIPSSHKQAICED